MKKHKIFPKTMQTIDAAIKAEVKQWLESKKGRNKMVTKLKPSAQYIARWQVTSMTSDAQYVVSMKADGTWACSCPFWKFHKAPKIACKHIDLILSKEPVDKSRTTPAAEQAFLRAGRKITSSAPIEPIFLLQTTRSIVLQD